MHNAVFMGIDCTNIFRRNMEQNNFIIAKGTQCKCSAGESTAKALEILEMQGNWGCGFEFEWVSTVTNGHVRIADSELLKSLRHGKAGIFILS